jgi:thiamine-monophosphate kinase
VDTGEFALVAELRSRFPLVGDDAAVVTPPSGPLLLAADAVVEGIDFVAPYDAVDVGWRAVLVNCSDIAAMGGRPLHVLVSLVAPGGVDLRGLVDGIAEGVTAHGCEVAGGDLSATSGPLVVSVAVTGAVDDDGGGGPVLRSGARPGDGAFVTGPLGAVAAAGYAVGRRRARLAEGVAARRAGATAMIDISDGFAADLTHVLDDSAVGVVLEHVPIAEGATEAQALGGGEDYELLFTLPPGATPPDGAIRVGTITADPSQRPPDVPGWQHHFS